jgi:hypothetical protein
MIDINIDSSGILSTEELVLILNLIEKRVEYGGDVPTTKQYLDLYDKIEKIVYQNDYKYIII